MVNEKWDSFVEAYCDMFAVSRDFVDKLAVHDIIQLIVHGYSNKSIASRLDMVDEYIAEVSQEYLGFEGFKSDLDINPYFAYRRSISFEDFVEEIKLLSSALDINYELCYNISILYDNIRKELEIWD